MKVRELMQELNFHGDNPLDIVAEIAIENNLKFTRPNLDELHLKVDGLTAKYEIFFVWQDEFRALQFCCQTDLKIQDYQRGAFAELVLGVNEKLWLGHFDLMSCEDMPCFRYTLMVRDESAECVTEQIADLIDYAVAECNRFYPAFQMVACGDVRVRDMLEAAMIDPLGEA